MIEEITQHTFDTVLGHDIQKNVVRQLVDHDRMPPSMLFYGPSGVGKKSFIISLVKYIQCKKGDAQKECDCTSCGKIKRGTFPDLVILGEKTRWQIKIEATREMQDWAVVTPIEGRKKIIVLFGAERMNPASANSLLKILEEPPRHLLIILETAHPYKMLPTIRSRCMGLKFSTIDPETIKDWLKEEKNMIVDRADVAAQLCEGRPGEAVKLAREELMSTRQTMLSELEILETHGFAALFRVADKMLKLDEYPLTLRLMLSYFRDLLVARASPESENLLIHQDLLSHIKEKATRIEFDAIYDSIMHILTSLSLSSRIINQQLFMENLLITIGKNIRSGR